MRVTALPRIADGGRPAAADGLPSAGSCPIASRTRGTSSRTVRPSCSWMRSSTWRRESARARWRVDPAAAFFEGHFPGNPILPGVIIVEALAQTGAIAALAEPESAGKLALFAGIERARFRRVVRPAEELVLETRLTRRRGPLGEGEATASVDGETACETTLRFALVDAATAGAPS